MPASAFNEAVALAGPFNRLVDAIARDTEWLATTLAATGAGDAFTGRLLDMHRRVVADGGGQALVLGIHRSDYMIDAGPRGDAPPRLRQVELNTVSSAFAGLSARVAATHAYLARRLARDFSRVAAAVPAGAVLPPNPSGVAVPAALAAAAAAYNARRGAADTVVAFVVQAAERNIMDQRLLEHELWEAHGVRARRVTLASLAHTARLDAAGALRLPCEGDAGASAGDDEVSVVYFRAGYTPDDFDGDDAWAGRELAERSAAVKCPNLAYHLVGTKKVQQVLATAGVVERFAASAEEAARLRACFAGLWTLDAAEVDAHAAAAVHAARQHPDAYVVKPQREGGGNNLYGAAVAAALAPEAEGGMPPSTRAAHILMERIWPAPAPAIFVKAGVPTAVSAVSELGIYGVFLGDGTRVLLDGAAGHLLRTKAVGTDEGGVAAGFAVLNSPVLLP